MSPADPTPASPSAPTSTALPEHIKEELEAQSRDGTVKSASSDLPAPLAKEFSQPHLRLRLNDLTDEGTGLFLSSISPTGLIPSAVSRVQKALYVSPNRGYHIPNIRSVTFVIRPMDGVAYTTGAELDPEMHKEIHFSSRYVTDVPSERHSAEIEGVIVHELVHCFQYNGLGDAPGGLIEGLADWVRLRAGLAPPHWRQGDELNGNWDCGYSGTAYFLQYLEERFGEGTVRRINEGLRLVKYEEKPFWTGLLGRPVGQLWEDYKEANKSLKKE